MEGTLVITPGSDATHIGVAWREADGTVTPTPAEERDLDAGGTPETLRAEFEGAKTKAALKKVGMKLWKCVAGGAAGTALAAARAAGLQRLFLDVTKAPPEWKGLPWEVLHDGDSWMGQQSALSLTRSDAGNTAPLATGWPFRFLVVCGQPETDKDIQVAAELEAIEDGLWRRRREIIVQTLIRPEENALRDCLLKFRPHVLHFIGHGSGDALRISEADDGSVVEWEVDDMRTWLSNGKGPMPHLVFLNACHTQSATTGADTASLTQTFLKMGVPAVVGMSGAVEGEAARVFARYFYQQWLDGAELDVAVTEARAQVATHAALAATPRQAHLPCLTLNQTPSQWMRWPVLPPTAAALLQDKGLDEVHRFFVDRNAERAALFNCWLPRAADVCAELPAEPVVLLLHGPRFAGKTDALRMALQAMLVRGWVARWHRVSGSSSMHWLALLTQLLDGDASGGELGRKLPDATFGEFRKFAASGVKTDAEGDMKKGFDVWRAGLQQMVDAIDPWTQKPTPIAIALDALGLGVTSGAALPAWLDAVARYFITPLLEKGVNGPILFALVLADEELAMAEEALTAVTGKTVQKLNLATFDPTKQVRPAMLSMPIGCFDPEDAVRAARQYFRQRWKDEVESSKNSLSEADMVTLQEVREALLKNLVSNPSNLLGQSLFSGFQPVAVTLSALKNR